MSPRKKIKAEFGTMVSTYRKVTTAKKFDKALQDARFSKRMTVTDFKGFSGLYLGSAKEHDEQKAFFQWCDLMATTGRIPELKWAFAVPNGGSRAAKEDKKGNRYSPESQRLKAEGVKSGVPDVEIPATRRGFTGLHIEFKRRDGGKVEHAQEEWHDALRGLGRCVFVANGWDQAKAYTDWYFGTGPWPSYVRKDFCYHPQAKYNIFPK